MKLELVVQEIMLFQDIAIFGISCHFAQRSICAILIDGIMENIHVKHYLYTVYSRYLEFQGTEHNMLSYQ